MNYFVLENVFTFNSGTEHSTIKRTQLFNQSGVPAKILTRNYNRFLANDMQKAGVDPQNEINMYDYFQGTTDVPRKEVQLRLLEQFPLDEYHIVAENPNFSWLKKAGRNIAKIEVMPATIGLISTVTYYDRFDNPTVRENFDWRGFKSSIEYFHPNGELATQRFLNLAGEPVLEITHMNIDGKIAPTMWKLINYKGHNYRFNFEDQLFLFFMNELAAQDQNATFISDRRSLDYVVADVQAPHKWTFLHDTHLVQPGNLMGELLPAYTTAVETRAKDFEGIMVLTDAQKSQLTLRFPTLNVQVVPDTFVTKESIERGANEHRDPVVLVSGRVAPDKRPDVAINIFKEVHRAVPTAKLRFVGYPASPEFQTGLETQVKNEGLEDSVEFAGYQTGTDLTQSYEQAKVLLNVSAHEGLGMHLVEAQAAGAPIVSFDVPYGPATLIENGQDGVLVPAGNQAAAVKGLTELLTDEQHWLGMHNASLAKAKQHLADPAISTFKEVMANSVGV